jgi:hypothetical protein
LQQVDQKQPQKRLHHHIAFFAISTLLLFVVVTLPFTVTSAFQDVLGSPNSRVFNIPCGKKADEAPEHSHVRIVISSIDELDRLLTMRVYIRSDFISTSDWKERIVLFAVHGTGEDAELPPSVSVDFPSSEFCSTQSVQLPIDGQPLRYPFDSYELNLGIIMQRVNNDGRVETMSPDKTRGRIFVELSEHLPRQSMGTPTDIDPTQVKGPNSKTRYSYVERITLHRPLYLKVMSILLVLLVAAAASYAVFMRPLSELIVNSGALVLGVWGIRAILVAGSSSFVSAVDIALATVILFLLMAISARALDFFKNKCEVSLPWWAHKPERTCAEVSEEEEINKNVSD